MQGTASYLGQKDGQTIGIPETAVERAHMTDQPGISPASCSLIVVPVETDLPEVGTLRFAFGNVLIEFPESLAAKPILRVGSKILWNVEILDRRWKWKYGHVSGEYNKRDPDGVLVSGTEKTPQELAGLLLDAMGESGYTVTQLPNDPRPYVNWDYSNPAEELATICESLGVLIVLKRATNKVVLEAINSGAELPLEDLITAGGDWDLSSSIRPTSLLLIGAPIQYQSRLKLEAVGLDTDDQVKTLANLSYKPTAGFNDPLFHGDVTASLAAQQLATQTVYRWYRVKEQAEGGFTLPGTAETLTSIDQMLPLNSGRLEKDLVTGEYRPKSPVVRGTFYGEDTDGANEVDEIYTGQFSVDTARGIVQFSAPVFKNNTGTNKWEPAELYLDISYSARNNSGQVIRQGVSRTLTDPSTDTEPQLIRQEEIERTIIAAYSAIATRDPGNDEDNVTDVLDEAGYYLDNIEDAMEANSAGHGSYAGLKNIELDGKIRQVSWSIGGGQATITEASRNNAANPYAPSYDQLRRAEREAKARKQVAELIAWTQRFVRRYLT